jgi:hypothetical protein
MRVVPSLTIAGSAARATDGGEIRDDVRELDHLVDEMPAGIAAEEVA